MCFDYRFVHVSMLGMLSFRQPSRVLEQCGGAICSRHIIVLSLASVGIRVIVVV